MKTENGEEYLEVGDVLTFEARLERRLFLHTYGLVEFAVAREQMPDQMMHTNQRFRVTIEAIEDQPLHVTD